MTSEQKQASNEERKALKKQQKEQKKQEVAQNKEQYQETEKTATQNKGARTAAPLRNAAKVSRGSGTGKR